MTDFEQSVVSGLARLQTEMEQVQETLSDQAAEIRGLQARVDELVRLKTEAAASARVLRWVWGVLSAIISAAVAWYARGEHK